MNSPRTTLYRDKQNAKFMGVLSGIADYTGVNALWIRLGFLILAVSMGWPILAYFVAGILLNKKPAHLYSARARPCFGGAAGRGRRSGADDPRGSEGLGQPLGRG